MNTTIQRAYMDQTARFPYHRLLSLRGQVEELEAALARPEADLSPRLPALALSALRAAVAAELEAAEREWQPRACSRRTRAA